MKKYDKYKPSGVEWIGEIPEGWDIATIGRLNNLGRGRVISNIEIGENSGEYPVYSSQTENNGIMGYLNSYDFEGQYVTWTTDGANAGTVFYRELYVSISSNIFLFSYLSNSHCMVDND